MNSIRVIPCNDKRLTQFVKKLQGSVLVERKIGILHGILGKSTGGRILKNKNGQDQKDDPGDHPLLLVALGGLIDIGLDGLVLALAGFVLVAGHCGSNQE